MTPHAIDFRVCICSIIARTQDLDAVAANLCQAHWVDVSDFICEERNAALERAAKVIDELADAMVAGDDETGTYLTASILQRASAIVRQQVAS